MRTQLITLLLFATACGGAQAPVPGAPPAPAPDESPDAPTPPAAPWQRTALGIRDVPAVFVDEWRQAANREHCALIAPVSLGSPSEATPRRANFSGGWGVAYDLPELRSAFGIAGTGVNAADSSYSEWPYSRTWSDGSTAGYGPEGGSGPNQLAYLRITGQGCLYNVWSRLGREHLEDLLERLRFVNTG